MNRSLEKAWREISQDLDEVLDLDARARQAWLDTLQAQDPQRAERVRLYILDLEKLESDNFLGEGLTALFPVELFRNVLTGSRENCIRGRRGMMIRGPHSCRPTRRNECV